MALFPRHPERRTPSGGPALARAVRIAGRGDAATGFPAESDFRAITGRVCREIFAVKTIYAGLITGLLLAAGPAAALEPLSQEKYINDRLTSARIADRIRRECPTIDARILYAFGEARKLKAYAQKKGYSNKQIDAFLDSKAEKKRIYAVAEDYLTRHGARPGDAASFCAIGKKEIAGKTLIGSFLVAK